MMVLDLLRGFLSLYGRKQEYIFLSAMIVRRVWVVCQEIRARKRQYTLEEDEYMGKKKELKLSDLKVGDILSMDYGDGRIFVFIDRVSNHKQIRAISEMGTKIMITDKMLKEKKAERRNVKDVKERMDALEQNVIQFKIQLEDMNVMMQERKEKMSERRSRINRSTR
jgi:hypothetical protein